MKRLNKEEKLSSPKTKRSRSTQTSTLIDQEQSSLYSLFMQAPIPIAILKGPNHVYEFCNPLTSEVLKVANPVGKSIKELFPNNKEIIKMLDATYKTGKPFTVSEYPINVDGPGKKSQTIYIKATYQPLRDEKNKVIGIMTTGVDVTEQVEARQKMQENEERSRVLSLHAPVGIFQTDKDGNCVFVNHRWCELTGMTPKKAYGQGWVKALHPEDRKRVLKEWYAAAKKNTEFLCEYRFKTSKGRITWVHGNAVSLHASNGNITGYLGTIVDITEKKRFEEQMQETSNLLKTILDTAPIGFCLFDKNLRFQMINQMLADINDISPEDHIGKTIQEIIPSLNDDITRELKNVLKTGKPIIGLELTGETKNEPGKIKHWSEDYFPVRSLKGEIIGIGALVVDITERKNQERQKDEFLGIASHELKTPVTSLKAFGQVIQKRLAKEGNEKEVLLLGKMDAQINKMMTLIQDLLDISRIEGERLQFTNDFFAFDELVSEVREEIQRTTEKHTLVIKGKTGKTIYGDRERIGQVITNFLTNAIKYSPNEKKIIIHTSATKLHIKLCVEDFGVGIPKNSIPHLFERYYRVKGETHDTVPGMGIGLYISSEIITRQGGTIWAESEKGKGSTFCFTLPVKGIKKSRKT